MPLTHAPENILIPDYVPCVSVMCILQLVTSGEWKSCDKVESVVGSSASQIKTPTDIVIISHILNRCSQLVPSHQQASIITSQVTEFHRPTKLE